MKKINEQLKMKMPTYKRKKSIAYFFYSCLLLVTISCFLSLHFQECEAASLYQAGGIAIDLRTDLPYGMEISHDDGGGPDGSFGGKLHVKLYGTVDTSHTQKITALAFDTDGMQYGLMFHLPENISADNFKAAYDKAYADNPENFYSISGQKIHEYQSSTQKECGRLTVFQKMVHQGGVIPNKTIVGLILSIR